MTKGSDERKHMEGISDIIKLPKETENPFLYQKEGQWYTNDYGNFTKDYFTNFVVLDSFPLTGDKIWNTVTRSGVGSGRPLTPENLARDCGPLAERDELLRRWSAQAKQNPGEQNDESDELANLVGKVTLNEGPNRN